MAGPVHRPVRGPGDPGHCEELGVAVGFCGGRNPREEREPAEQLAGFHCKTADFQGYCGAGERERDGNNASQMTQGFCCLLRFS